MNTKLNTLRAHLSGEPCHNCGQKLLPADTVRVPLNGKTLVLCPKCAEKTLKGSAK